MNDLKELVDLERFTGLSSAEIEAAKTDFHMSTCRDPIWQCPDCASKLKALKLVIAAVSPVVRDDERSALESAGRLLPEGATHTSEFAVRWYLADQTFIEWGCDSLDRARRAANEPLSEAVRGEIRSQTTWVGPWSVVEPVGVPGVE